MLQNRTWISDKYSKIKSTWLKLMRRKENLQAQKTRSVITLVVRIKIRAPFMHRFCSARNCCEVHSNLIINIPTGRIQIVDNQDGPYWIVVLYVIQSRIYSILNSPINSMCQYIEGKTRHEISENRNKTKVKTDRSFTFSLENVPPYTSLNNCKKV